ncbi:MAG: outer membrane protein assembly factor BamD [Flavobacteriaceae bacterium]
MKKIVFYFLLIASFNSCSEYYKVLNKGDIKSQYKLAEELYEEGKYSKAMVLFEKIAPSFARKPQLQRIRYMSAKSDYALKNYSLASYRFNRFVNNYPNSSKIEEVYYLLAQSQFKTSPSSSLDQKDTHKALDVLQEFLDKYPNSKYTDEINKQFKELTTKLEEKAYDIAYLYYKTEKYKSAIIAFDNFISEYLGAKHKEDALFYKFKSTYQLAIKSVNYKKEQRLKDAISAHKRFNKYYPKSSFKKEADNLVEKITKNLEIFQENTTTKK